jgi:hypothetical protein
VQFSGPVPRDVSARRLLSPVPEVMMSPSYVVEVKSSDEESDTETPLLIDADFSDSIIESPLPPNGIDVDENVQVPVKVNGKKAYQHNLKIRDVVIKHVKRPGKSKHGVRA